MKILKNLLAGLVICSFGLVLASPAAFASCDDVPGDRAVLGEDIYTGDCVDEEWKTFTLIGLGLIAVYVIVDVSTEGGLFLDEDGNEAFPAYSFEPEFRFDRDSGEGYTGLRLTRSF